MLFHTKKPQTKGWTGNYIQSCACIKWAFLYHSFSFRSAKVMYSQISVSLTSWQIDKTLFYKYSRFLIKL